MRRKENDKNDDASEILMSQVRGVQNILNNSMCNCAKELDQLLAIDWLKLLYQGT